MIVTNCTSQRHAHEDRGHGFRAIDGVPNQHLFVDRTAFTGRYIAAIEARGNFLVDRGFRQQIAGKLFDRKLIEWFVGVECIDDPFAIFPKGSLIVQMQTVRIAVTHQVQPVAGHLFAKTR